MWWFTAYFLYGSGTAQCNWRRRTLYGNGRSTDCTKYAYNDNQVSRNAIYDTLMMTAAAVAAVGGTLCAIQILWTCCTTVSTLSFTIDLIFHHFFDHSAMSTYRNREELGPMTRNRSSSANEASKPVLVMQRRQTQGSKTLNFSPSNSGSAAGKFLHTFLLHGFLYIKNVLG